MSPVPFDRVQVRAVSWQEKRQQTLFKDGIASVCGSAVMLGGIIQYQHNGTVIRCLLYQRIEKGDKGVAVLLG